MPFDYKCENTHCRAVGKGTKQLQVAHWPRTLVIHLKRWKVDAATGCTFKIRDFIAFNLTMSVDDGTAYKLRSIVVHLGADGARHYVTYTNDDAHGWLLYDDAFQPKQVSEKQVLQQRAYLLCYEQI